MHFEVNENENWTQKLLDSPKAVLKRTFIAGIANIREENEKKLQNNVHTSALRKQKKKHKLNPK